MNERKSKRIKNRIKGSEEKRKGKERMQKKEWNSRTTEK